MLSIEQVIKATNGDVIFKGEPFFTGVSIDSRTIREGELFLALKGERFDGHDFLFDALKLARGAVINRLPVETNNSIFKDKTIIVVKDTLRALHDMANYIRKGFRGNVIGVVGSNGKTTTKELIFSILSTRLNVLKTKGNLNNHVGMPLSIINGFFAGTGHMSPDVMVLEMGANRPDDIDELCRIAMPDIGVVTNIGYEHLEGFGSLDEVRESELEILSYINRLIANADDSFLMEGVKGRFNGDLVSFGIKKGDVDLRATNIVFSEEGINFTLCTKKECIKVNTRLLGMFNVYNCIAASALAFSLGFNLDEIKTGIEGFGGVEMRFGVKRLGKVTFLNDVYNANPSSMKESLNELTRLIADGGRSRRAIAVLGDMLELGDFGIYAHKELGRIMSDLPIDIFIGVGDLMSLAISEFRGKGIHVNTSDEAGFELKKMLADNDIVLIKGSRGMRMERVLSVVEGNIDEQSYIVKDQGA